MSTDSGSLHRSIPELAAHHRRNASMSRYDAKWWRAADTEERSGFLEGAADCLTWTAREKGFNATPSQLVDRITNFYTTHPRSASFNVVDVWRRLSEPPPSSTDPQGETWTNPHWYLNGDWWAQVSEDEHLGRVEGYLWCMRTRVHATADSYSESASLYRRKIDAFVKAHPKRGLEAVATTLRRFRDKSAPAVQK